MRNMNIVCTVLIFVMSASMTPAQTPMPIQRAHQTMYMDGNLDESVWQNAPAFSPFVFTWYESGKQEQTEAKMLWDDEFLYVAFKSEDANISGTRTQRNDQVYKDDCVELFIAPNINTPMVYMNFEINCLASYLACEHPTMKDKEWQEPKGLMIGRSHKGTINDDTDTDDWWIIEMAVPFRVFEWTGVSLPPKTGMRMRLNLNRLGGEVNNQKSQWQRGDPNDPGFHRPQFFGDVILKD
jgi:hypothetical protein